MRFIAIFFCFINVLHAFSDFDYSLDYEKRVLVPKEVMLLKLHISQKNAKEVMSFDFLLPSNDAYSVELLDSQESKDTQGRVRLDASYLLYPLKSGKYTIQPHIIVKKASREELKKFVTGSADELMYLRTRNKDVALDTIEITVKSLDRSVDLVGDYQLEHRIDKREIQEGEQVNVVYVLSGKGYKPELNTLLDENFSADMFMDKERVDKKLFHKEIFNYAIGGCQNFAIPAVSLLAYNPANAAYYTLTAPKIAVKVEQVNDEYPIMIDQKEELAWERYVNYLLLFLAGYALQKLWQTREKKELQGIGGFIFRVKKAKSEKALLQTLLSENPQLFKVEIKRLETMLYHDRKDSLAQIKRAVITRLKRQEEDDNILS